MVLGRLLIPSAAPGHDDDDDDDDNDDTFKPLGGDTKISLKRINQ